MHFYFIEICFNTSVEQHLVPRPRVRSLLHFPSPSCNFSPKSRPLPPQTYDACHIGNQMTKRRQISTNLSSKLKEKKVNALLTVGQKCYLCISRTERLIKIWVQSTHHPPGMLNYVNWKTVPQGLQFPLFPKLKNANVNS